MTLGKYTLPHLAKSALVTIDTQNDFSLPGSPALIPGTMEVVPNMVRLLDAYRSAARPIIHVVRIYQPDGSNVDLCRREAVESGVIMLAPGSHGVQLVDALKPGVDSRLDTPRLLAGEFQAVAEREFIMYKPRWGSFYQTDLEHFLRRQGCDTLVLCGCNFPNCPRATLYQASERDFRLVLVVDAISQLYPQGEAEMQNIQVALLRTTEVIDQIASPASPSPEL
ncbi:MAG: isochorismatase family cysteine hydrolase [Candidatus Thiodiazotropha sp.]